MTAYATCAKTGCYEQICYDERRPVRSRYCFKHRMEMTRGGTDDAWMDIATNPMPKTKQIPVILPREVILKCPICKTRVTVPEDIKGYALLCENGCKARLIYHKDVK